MTEELLFPAGAFVKLDASDDALFYEQPRLVNHIDERAIAALTEFYRTSLPPGGRLLDLMSSWVSHLPRDVVYNEVIGLGMNHWDLLDRPEVYAKLENWLSLKRTSSPQ